MRVLIFCDVELVIIKGVVMFVQVLYLFIIWVMVKIYGIDINEIFDLSKYLDEKKIDICGVSYCEDVFDILVKEDEQVKVGEKRMFFFLFVYFEQIIVLFCFFSIYNKKVQFVID